MLRTPARLQIARRLLPLVAALAVPAAPAWGMGSYPYIPPGLVNSDHSGRSCSSKHAWWKGTTGSDSIGRDGTHVKVKLLQVDWDAKAGVSIREFRSYPTKGAKRCTATLRFLGGRDNHLVKTTHPKLKWDRDIGAYVIRFALEERFTGVIGFDTARRVRPAR